MPTDGGKIYRDTNSTPTKGISLDDIGVCLQMQAREIGVLCQGVEDYEAGTADTPALSTKNEYYGLINRWSKAKPVWFLENNAFLGPDATSEQKEERWKGNDTSAVRKNPYIGNGNEALFDMAFSMEIPTGAALFGDLTNSGDFLSSSGQVVISPGTRYEDLMSQGGWLCGLLMDGQKIISTDVVTLRWRYEPPLVNSTIPFRVLDFDGYNHYAVNPMPTISDGKRVGVTFDNNDNPSSISIPIRAELPSVPGNDGNITFDELSELVKSRGTVGTNIGLKDMYLCAVVYYVEWGGGDNDVDIKYCFWGSSAVKYSDSPNNGWDTINLTITNDGTRIQGLNIGTLKTLLLKEPGNHDNNGDQRWKIKFFWCTEQIATNGLPTGDYKLVRGNDSVPAGRTIWFVSASSSATYPFVTITNDLHVTPDPDFEDMNSYAAAFEFSNPSNNPVTISRLFLIGYIDGDLTDPIDEEVLAHGSTAPYNLINPITIPPNGHLTVSLDLEGQTDNFTDFLLFAYYGESNDYELGKVCGAVVRADGSSFTFGQDDAQEWPEIADTYAIPE